EIKGKCAYMSPEQSLGQPLTASSDLFSLGVVLWESAMCRPLFDRDTDVETLIAVREHAVAPLTDVPAPLAELIARMLERDPEKRPRSSAMALQELDARMSVPLVEVAQESVRALVAAYVEKQ